MPVIVIKGADSRETRPFLCGQCRDIHTITMSRLEWWFVDLKIVNANPVQYSSQLCNN
jgi:hypothetical protein